MGDGKSWAGSCQSRKWSDVLDSSVEAGLKTGASEAIAIFQMRDEETGAQSGDRSSSWPPDSQPAAP
ncbi:unnamed protein product [Rangifer tarandus platyrhynchus]|uniref:Uncharacterized protein n=1 Tax=Rangifer tarandus platyrhynchus TaxID=3082113 RepID=A0ABN8ZUX3_RANTA|nr:unnamed protein product [Rangifer tarandus platyrhynchus]